MSKIRLLAPVIGAAALLATGMQNSSSAQEITLKLGTTLWDGLPGGLVLAEIFIPKIEEYSNGRMTVEAHWASSVCAEHACGEQMRLGQIDVATTSTANFGAFASTYNLFDLPYLMKDAEAGNKLALGWLGKELHARAVDDSGFKVFGVFPAGQFRTLNQSERVVRVPADMEGLKFRVTKSPINFTLLKSWGGVPIPYNWPQLYQGIQTGILHGSYIPIPWLVLGKMYEVAPYFTFMDGAYAGMLIYMDAKRFDSLPDWAQDAVDKAMHDTVLGFHEHDLKWFDDAYAFLKENANIYHPTEEEMKLWRAAAVEAWVGAKGTFDPALARRALEDQGLTDFIEVLDDKGALD